MDLGIKIQGDHSANGNVKVDKDGVLVFGDKTVETTVEKVALWAGLAVSLLTIAILTKQILKA